MMKKALKQKNSCTEVFSFIKSVCQFMLPILMAQDDISITFLHLVTIKAVYLGRHMRFSYLWHMLIYSMKTPWLCIQLG